MSIWNKILLGLILVSLLAFFYISARMLKTQKYWSELAGKFETRIGELQKEDKDLQPNIEQMRSELKKLSVDRQRVWYDCDPAVNINRQTGAVSVAVKIEKPSPSGISKGSILHVFEAAGTAQKGRYLGEFKATAAADKQITLEPAFNLTSADLEKLATAKKPWNLYDSLPHDSHEILAQLNEQDKKAMLPPDVVEEYIKDGQAAADGKTYERPLRNYNYLFDAYRMKITELADQEQAMVRDWQLVKAAQEDALRQVQFYQKQATVTKALRDKFISQRDAVMAHLDKVKEKLAEIKQTAAKLYEDNKAMAGQIAKIQLDATRLIDQRTRAMAQTANGEN
jgi:hypothetical protein